MLRLQTGVVFKHPTLRAETAPGLDRLPESKSVEASSTTAPTRRTSVRRVRLSCLMSLRFANAATTLLTTLAMLTAHPIGSITATEAAVVLKVFYIIILQTLNTHAGAKLPVTYLDDV